MSTSASESERNESSRPLLQSALAGIAVGLVLWLGSSAIRTAWGDEYGYLEGDPEPECFYPDDPPEEPPTPPPD